MYTRIRTNSYVSAEMLTNIYIITEIIYIADKKGIDYFLKTFIIMEQ